MCGVCVSKLPLCSSKLLVVLDNMDTKSSLLIKLKGFKLLKLIKLINYVQKCKILNLNIKQRRFIIGPVPKIADFISHFEVN